MDRNTMNETFKKHNLKWRTAEFHFGVAAIDEGFHPRDWLLVDTKTDKVVALGDSKHGTVSNLPTAEKVYEKLTAPDTEPVKSETKSEPKTETIENENEDILAWFADKDRKRNHNLDTKVNSIPETTVALDTSSRRYAIENGTIIRYRNLTNKETGEKFICRENFGSTNFVWTAVLEALNV